MVIEAAGFKFAVAKWSAKLVAGMRVDVTRRLGREVLVASNPALDGGAG